MRGEDLSPLNLNQRRLFNSNLFTQLFCALFVLLLGASGCHIMKKVSKRFVPLKRDGRSLGKWISQKLSVILSWCEMCFFRDKQLSEAINYEIMKRKLRLESWLLAISFKLDYFIPLSQYTLHMLLLLRKLQGGRSCWCKTIFIASSLPRVEHGKDF